MKRIYSHPDVAMVHLIKNELEQHGIQAVVRGEHAAAIVGGGAGIDAWSELWVVDAGRLQEAARVVQQVIDAPAPAGAPWTCPQCGEEVEAAFGVCWKCGTMHPGEST